ncbi:right-handed parallel beta-helix repeat-containing protein [Kribbella qitaiheensis]|nr:right-handed parallel beta-helix repeat-containing protein [Kribbella qitaiheensis]
MPGLDRRTLLLAGGAAALAAVTAPALEAQAKSTPAASLRTASGRGRSTLSFPTVDVQADCGAAGDGVTNDSAAFRQAALTLQAAGGGTLVIPAGIYVVGEQVHTSGVTPYYVAQPVFSVHDLDLVDIQGNGAVLRLADGLHYGSFDPNTGAVANPTTQSTLPERACKTGNILEFTQCQNVTINDLEIDGRSDHLVLGGPWGDNGRQLPGSGIWLQKCSEVQIVDVTTHHHPLDGVYIAWAGLTGTDPATPHTLTRVVSEYNGRQGLSWVGGRGLTCTDCSFSHTGRGALSSAPAAGLDIEPQGTVCRDGRFENCHFEDNAGVGMLAAAGDGGYTTFVDCTFWGTTNYSIWCRRPYLAFEGCTVRGSAVHTYGSAVAAEATQFTSCTFADELPSGVPSGSVFRTKYLYDSSNDCPNVSWDGCTFTANQVKTIYVAGSTTAPAALTGCTFVHRTPSFSDGATHQCIIRNSTIEGTRFSEDFPPGTTTAFYISRSGVTVSAGAATVVDGPLVRWGSTSGLTGTIPPGSY